MVAESSIVNKLMKLLTSLPSLTALLLLFTCLGAVVMMKLENSQHRGAGPEQVDANFLHKLYEIRTMSSKLLSREAFVEAGKRQIAEWERMRMQLEWSFNSAFLYCFTLYTTIGYGHAHPSSLAGKWFSVLYSIIGIPLFLLYAARLGACLQRRLRGRLLAKVEAGAAEPDEELPLPLTVALLAGHSLLGAIMFAVTERWSLTDGMYFSLISVTSVGLGDMVPSQESSIKLAASVLHLTIGVSLCSIMVNKLNSLMDRALVESADAMEKERKD